MPEIVAINRSERLAVTDDDIMLRFEMMLNSEGDETDDPEQAVVAVAPHPNGDWWTIDLRCFTAHKAH